MPHLSVPNEVTFATFTVVSSTSAFPISFAVFEKANLTVLIDGVALTQSDFGFAGTILEGGGYQGGTVTLNTPVSGVVVRIERNIAPARASNYSPSASVPVRSLDMALNRQMAVTQDIHRRQGDLEEYVSGETGALALSVNEAQGHALAAQASADAAEADRVQTGLDRVQTGLDRVATAADRVQTGLDRAATAADRVQTGLDRVATAADVAAAQVARTGAEAAAYAAGAPLYTVMPTAPFTGVPSPFLLAVAGAGTAIYDHDGSTATFFDWLGTVVFDTVASLLASTGELGGAGNTVVAGGYRYQVVTSGAHVTTAGGVGLIVVPDPAGYYIEAFGIDLTNSTGMSTALAAADAVAFAAGRPLVGTPGTVKLDASLTHSAKVITNGIKFHFEGGVVQTFSEQFVAGREEVFVGSVGAAVGPRFASGSVDAMFPEWFGAKAYNVIGGTPFDSAPAVLKTHQAAARLLGFAYKIEFGQGIYGFAKGIDVPTAGDCHVVGQGIINTQFRAINTGAGHPDYIYKLISSTTNTRFSGIYFYGGSSSRPTKYGIYSLEMKHTHADACLFSSFNIAGFVSAEWDNQVEDCEFEFCHVGFWSRRAGGNNNDLTIDTCRFVSCEVGVVLNAGTSCRVRNGQFQAALVAPFTKTFGYFQGISGFSFDNNYVETQATGGLKGLAISDPVTLTIQASLIFNAAPYFTDEVGTVTTTLSQSSSNLGTVGSVTDNLFASPAYYQAGSGSSGYTAGAVTFEALTGTGTGASGTCTVQTVGGVAGIVTSASPGGGAGGTKFMIGDIVKVVQGGVDTARATVASTGTNNSIASLYIGHAAAIYPGHIRRLTVSGNLFSPSSAVVSLYNDRAICDPQKIEFRMNGRPTSGIEYQVLGPLSDTINVRLGDITVADAVFDAAPGSGLSRRNYKPDSWAFSATPIKSVFTRNSGRYKGYPWYRLKLLPGEKVSDTLEFSVTIASSGASNSELIGRTVYLSALKNEGQSNTRLRLALEMVNGSDTLVRQNYDAGTSFTKSASEGREETSLIVGNAGGTLRGKIQVIAASAAEQHVDFAGVILTIAGVSVDLFSVADFERPLQASASWAPGAVSAGAKAAVFTIPCLGARAGDLVEVNDLTFDPGYEMDWRVARKAVQNGIEIYARNVSSTTLGGWTQTIRARVHPST